mmetsp:Transcript_40133/g.54515  ORF Transcript_40133/g.54515 Transcript_40133/m.54515 type:complete len:97 (+) Transcript_40133:2273-2563(+)
MRATTRSLDDVIEAMPGYRGPGYRTGDILYPCARLPLCADPAHPSVLWAQSWGVLTIGCLRLRAHARVYGMGGDRAERAQHFSLLCVNLRAPPSSI